MEAEWSVLRCHLAGPPRAVWLINPGVAILARSLAFDLLYVLARQRGKYRSGRIWEPIALSPSSRVVPVDSLFIPSSFSIFILYSHNSP